MAGQRGFEPAKIIVGLEKVRKDLYFIKYPVFITLKIFLG